MYAGWSWGSQIFIAVKLKMSVGYIWVQLAKWLER